MIYSMWIYMHVLYVFMFTESIYVYLCACAMGVTA